MELSQVIEQLDDFADVGTPVQEGDLCVVWINGIVTYAVCYKIDADFAIGWNDCYFYSFDRLPPRLLGWKITHDHLAGDTFTFNNIPVAIIRLDIAGMDIEEIKEINWDDFLGGK